MTKLLYGTGNPAKLEAMRRRLEPLNVEIIGLQEINQEIPVVEEDGFTPLDNARIKAIAYYKAFGIPVFSCDSGMYIKELPEHMQPGVHVRRINRKYLNDEEMLEYYSGLAKTYGKLTARYQNAICLICGEEQRYELMDETLASKPFHIGTVPHKIRKEGFPIDSLSIDIKTGKYYYDLPEEELDLVAVENGFLEFFQSVRKNILEN